MNLLSLFTLSPGGQRDFSAAWSPDDLLINTAEGTAGGNVSDEYRSKDKLHILTTPICLLFISGTGMNEERWLSS